MFSEYVYFSRKFVQDTDECFMILMSNYLNPKVHSPPFAATVATAVPIHFIPRPNLQPLGLNPKVDSPLFAATVAAAALSTTIPGEDQVYHPLGLSQNVIGETTKLAT